MIRIYSTYRLAALLLVLPALVPAAATPDPVVSWRAAFRSSGDPDGLDSFLDLMKSIKEPDPVASAFYATAEIMRAAGRRNPFAKFTGFRKWTGVLDRLAPDGNPDISFLRFTVWTQAPGFLGGGDQIKEDCPIIASALTNGYWTDDPVHRTFVSEVFTQAVACK